MDLIDCASWKPLSNEYVFAYRYPQTNLNANSQIIVSETQEALLFSGGRIIGEFGPGKHFLNTENKPFIRNLFQITFGGLSPSSYELWVVNKLYPSNLSWKVTNIVIRDVDYQTMLPLCAEGQYGLYVTDASKFLKKFVGVKDVFTVSDLTSKTYGEFFKRTKSAIIQFMDSHHVGFKSLSAHLDNLSLYIKDALVLFWQEYGLAMPQFYVTDVTIDKLTAQGQLLSEVLASRASGKGLLAGMMAINKMGTATGNNFAVREIYCANCSKKHLTTEVFCPHCGNEYNPCPRCGSDNLKTSRRCVSCGTPLEQTKMGAIVASQCSMCGTSLPSGSTFCPNCGARQNQITIDRTCPRCGVTIPLTSHFCPNCGRKI